LDSFLFIGNFTYLGNIGKAVSIRFYGLGSLIFVSRSYSFILPAQSQIIEKIEHSSRRIAEKVENLLPLFGGNN